MGLEGWIADLLGGAWERHHNVLSWYVRSQQDASVLAGASLVARVSDVAGLLRDLSTRRTGSAK